MKKTIVAANQLFSPDRLTDLQIVHHPHLEKIKYDAIEIKPRKNYMKGLEDIHLRILRASDSVSLDPNFKRYSEEAFQLWFDVWTDTLFQLDKSILSGSEDFTRQSEIIGLWHRNVCIAVICHRFVDLNYKYSLMDSYFKCWPQQCVSQLVKMGHTLAIGSYIAVHPAYRKSGSVHLGFNVKKAIAYSSLQALFNNVSLDLICSTARVDKGVAQLLYGAGAKNLAHGIMFHGVPVDLIYIDMNEQAKVHIEEKYLNLIQHLWETRYSGGSQGKRL